MIKKLINYPDKNFNEGLKDLRVDDQLNLIRISGGDVGHRPGRLLHDVWSEKHKQLK